MPRFRIVYITIFMAIFCMGKAQTLKFEQFTTKDGLLSDEVYNLHQDKKGYIWLFTNNGAMKYNGKTFEPVLKNLPFNESFVYAIYENKKGRKWVANSNKNIYEIINDSAFIVQGIYEHSTNFKKNVNDIYQIYVDDSLNIYVKTMLQCLKFVKSKGYELVDMEYLLADDSLDEMVLDFGNNILMAVNGHVNPLNSYVIQTKKIKLCYENDFRKGESVSFSERYFSKYYKRYNNIIYTIFFSKLIKINSDRSLKEVVVNEQILNFTKDDNGHTWLACYRNGLIELDENDSIVSHYFKGKTVHDVLIDSHQGLWISTDGKGIYHCQNINRSYYDEGETFGKPVNFIKKIGKQLFIGTTDFNLSFIEDGKIHKLDKLNSQLIDDPLNIFFGNSFYIVSYRVHYELVESRNGKLSLKQMPKDSSSHCPLMIEDYSADILMFMGRNRLGLVPKQALFQGNKNFKAKNVKSNYRVNYIKKIGSELFVGTEKGMLVYKNDSLIRPAYLDSLAKCVITKLVTDKWNNTWICTRGNGLFVLNDQKQLINYKVSNGLSSNVINDIYFENDSSFLVSSNKGLHYYKRYSKTGLDDYMMLVKGEVQSSLIFNDKIYVATKTGIITINTKFLNNSPFLFFNLNGIFVNEHQVSLNTISALNYQENNLKFRFDVMSFSDEHYSLKYKLQNTMIDTGIVDEDELNFKRLSPGSYTLTVWPIGIGQKQKIELFFTIIPAFWQTIWFLILMIFAGLLLVIFFAWILFKSYKERALKKSEAEKIIAEYRLIALKAQINPHFMSNCIAAIQHLILHNKVDEANEYLAKFSFLVRQVLNLSNKSLVPLAEELEIIDLYVKLEKLRFEKINVEFHIDPAIDRSNTLIPPLLAQPIIENAIWHGLLPLGKEKNPLLSISVKSESSLLKIIIEDNGVGRQIGISSISNSRESKGIAITKQRIENLKYLNDRDVATLLYQDLFDIEGKPSGTKVIISLSMDLQN